MNYKGFVARLTSLFTLYTGMPSTDACTYKLRRGDRLEDVAERYSTTVGSLLAENPQIRDSDRIYHGRKIEVPCSSQAQKSGKYDGERAKRKKVPVERFPSGLELEVVKDPRLIGDERCSTYDWKTRKGRQLIDQRCSFYNPRPSKTPLVRVRPADLGKQLSPYFTVGEFAHIQPEDLRYSNPREWQKVDGKHYYRFIRVNQDLLHELGDIRERAKMSMLVDEGYRSYRDNMMMYFERCRGKKTVAAQEKCAKLKSFHPGGNAVDLVHSPRIRRAAHAELQGCGGIGQGPCIDHIDNRRKKARWRY